uniref:Putative secreted protein n=1 Tax=Ixodes ricinus TaxID=34613 RepID=A0A6B0U0U9_IXORI
MAAACLVFSFRSVCRPLCLFYVNAALLFVLPQCTRTLDDVRWQTDCGHCSKTHSCWFTDWRTTGEEEKKKHKKTCTATWTTRARRGDQS